MRRTAVLFAAFTAVALVVAGVVLLVSRHNARRPYTGPAAPVPVDTSLAAWRPPPVRQVAALGAQQQPGQPHGDGCPLASETDQSMPFVEAWINALDEANITYFATGSEGFRALRFGSNTLRLRGKDLGVSAHPGHGSHDFDLFAIFPDKAAAAAAYAWLGSKFAGHPDFKCACCAGSCRQQPSPAAPDGSCSCLSWRVPPPGSAEAGYSWQWTRAIETFTGIVHNKTHVKMGFDPIFYLPIVRTFPLRAARLSPTLTLPVARDFMWFYSHKASWGSPQAYPAYGQGCRQVAYPSFLSSTFFGIAERRWDSYADVRLVEKGLFQCARWLHQHGYASFYGCFDEDVGFDEAEDGGAGAAAPEDWHKIIGDSWVWRSYQQQQNMEAIRRLALGLAGLALIAGAGVLVSRHRGSESPALAALESVVQAATMFAHQLTGAGLERQMAAVPAAATAAAAPQAAASPSNQGAQYSTRR
jgi:hypothetical protein